MVLGNLAAFNYGSCIVLPNENFNAQASLECVTKYSCTTIYGVPTMYIEYLKLHEKNPQAYNITSLYKGLMSGSFCPANLIHKTINILGMKQLAICYGMTELSPVVSMNRPNDTLADRLETVGAIMPHVEAKIIDENGQIVPRNTIGQVCFRGYTTMIGYFNNLEKTKETLKEDGWLMTGDLAYINDRGYLNIKGRSKEMIIRGGENIYPVEVEDFLIKMPGVLNVTAIGVPDEKFGEELFVQVIVK